MQEIPIPFTNMTIDPSEADSLVMSLVLLVAGMFVFSLSRDTGDYLADRASDTISDYTGVNPTGGDGNDSPAVV